MSKIQPYTSVVVHKRYTHAARRLLLAVWILHRYRTFYVTRHPDFSQPPDVAHASDTDHIDTAVTAVCCAGWKATTPTAEHELRTHILQRLPPICVVELTGKVVQHTALCRTECDRDWHGDPNPSAVVCHGGDVVVFPREARKALEAMLDPSVLPHLATKGPRLAVLGTCIHNVKT